MAKLEPHGWVIDFVLFLNRVAMGLYLLLAGVAKVRGGVANFVEKAFAPMRPAWLPEAIATPYGYAIPYLEVILGATLLLGLLGRLSAFLTFLMITSFTIALVVKNQSFVHGPGPFSANFIMIALALLLAVAGPGRFSLDRALFARAKAQPTGSAA
jgi:uncharacterized membrane protein YphA (DoxX/SURF4 family)